VKKSGIKTFKVGFCAIKGDKIYGYVVLYGNYSMKLRMKPHFLNLIMFSFSRLNDAAWKLFLICGLVENVKNFCKGYYSGLEPYQQSK